MAELRERTAKEKELKMSCKTCKFYIKREGYRISAKVYYHCEKGKGGNANKICYLWERKND